MYSFSSVCDLCRTTRIKGQSDCSIPVEFISSTKEHKLTYFKEGKESAVPDCERWCMESGSRCC